MYKEQLDLTRIPQHIAIIMDGNGRWAKAQGKHRGEGHIAGAQALHDVMVAASKLGVKYVTVYAFSTENWRRPDEEVAELMSLLFKKLDLDIFMDNNIRFCVIGDTDRLPADVQERMHYCIDKSAANPGHPHRGPQLLQQVGTDRGNQENSRSRQGRLARRGRHHRPDH